MHSPQSGWLPFAFGFSDGPSSRQQRARASDSQSTTPPDYPTLSSSDRRASSHPNVAALAPTMPPSRRLTRRFTGSENPELQLPQMSEPARARGPRVSSSQQTDIALILAGKFEQNEFSMLLVILILSSTVVFCHSLIRAYVLITRPVQHPASDPLYNVHGYAIPAEPIPVILARDEEAAGIESETTKLSPPAYGLWRSSVRVDPDGLRWQPNPNATSQEPDRPRVEPRPPSYASDDGITYVVDAVPRSTVASEDNSLPLHPSEVGRVNPSLL
ncbi:hypothetical protein HOO65_040243 [Ceratocystis lukuohia]|uniref:Transmembrane protein n=1 Tax=Ceratocystis lukuohia TaxID=2019550 RepID=A0ABR4MI17_9PEZI